MIPPPPPPKWLLEAQAADRRESQIRQALDRRARIAAAVIARPVPVGALGLPDLSREIATEDVPSIACRIDREIEAITRGEAEGRS